MILAKAIKQVYIKTYLLSNPFRYVNAASEAMSPPSRGRIQDGYHSTHQSPEVYAELLIGIMVARIEKATVATRPQ